MTFAQCAVGASWARPQKLITAPQRTRSHTNFQHAGLLGAAPQPLTLPLFHTPAAHTNDYVSSMAPPHTQIKAESFVEDINNLLNSGEVPNMFPYDERAAVLEQCRTLSKKEGLALDSAVGALLFTCFMPSCVVGVGCPLVCWGVLCGSPYGSASDFSGSRHSSSAVALMHQA